MGNLKMGLAPISTAALAYFSSFSGASGLMLGALLSI
jgi:hypothetical protein